MPSPRLSCSAESATLLVILPLLDAIRMSWIFTALPLYYDERGWELWRLAILFSLTNLTRLPINFVIVWLGEWVLAILAAVMVVAQLPMVLAASPSEALVFVGITVPGMCRMVQGFRGLCYHRYGENPDVQNHALRWITTANVFGYAFGAMVGGVAFDFGGFKACVWFQFLACTVELFLVCCSPSVHEVWREWRQPTITPTAVTTGDGDAGATKHCGDAASTKRGRCAPNNSLAAAAAEAAEQSSENTNVCSAGNLKTANILGPTVLIVLIEFARHTILQSTFMLCSSAQLRAQRPHGGVRVAPQKTHGRST